MSNRHRAIGIDLGTSYSASCFRYGKVEIIPNEEGNRTTPSYVSFTDKGRLIGDAAKRHVNLNPYNTVYNVERLIGRQFDDSVVQADMKYMPFKIVNDNGKPKIQIEYKKEIKLFTPEEILSMILSKMKEIAETYLEEKVSAAIISVPAYFNSAQCLAIRDAGVIAGLNVRKIINGSTLASIAYGVAKKVSDACNVLIFDLGGGTCNVSIVEIEEGLFVVNSTAGDTHLGGEDFDNRLVAHFVREFSVKYGKDLSRNKRALQRLRIACERAKCFLSSSSEASIQIESLYEKIDFFSNITRARFEELCADLFRSTLEPVEKALRDAKMDKASIHEIVLVGGSTRIPKVQKLLQDLFNGKELNKSINPDEAAACGAATDLAKFTDYESVEFRDVLLHDVLPFSLGIETTGGIMTTIIKRNTSIPTRCTHTLTTDSDNQPGIFIRVFEGDRAMTIGNRLLGVLELSGIPPAPRGVPQIQVTFDRGPWLCSSLIVSVTEGSTGKENKMNITNNNCLSEEQIERMQSEAKKFKKDDEIQRECNAVKQSLESYCFDTKATINDERLAHKIDTNERINITKNIEKIFEWMETNQDAEKDEYERKLQEINKICNPVLTKLSCGIPDDKSTRK